MCMKKHVYQNIFINIFTRVIQGVLSSVCVSVHNSGTFFMILRKKTVVSIIFKRKLQTADTIILYLFKV